MVCLCQVFVLQKQERHRTILEEKCSGMSTEIEELQREVQKLRPLQGIQDKIQRQYAELQERTQNAVCEARRFFINRTDDGETQT